MTFTSKERNFLRKLAHNITPVVRIGKNGFNEEVMVNILNVINKQELIKIKLMSNTDEKITDVILNEIENRTKGYVISTIGHSIIMFKPVYKNNEPLKYTKMFFEFRKQR